MRDQLVQSQSLPESTPLRIGKKNITIVKDLISIHQEELRSMVKS